MEKPSMFIGSSTGGLGFARVIKRKLEEASEVVLWDEDFFPPGNTFIETLMEASGRFDFALLILTADDLTRSKNIDYFSPRDNVIFELGLFMGKLGRSRTLIMQPKSGIKVPTDLSGLTTVNYDWPREDNDVEKSIETASKQILNVIRTHGFLKTKLANEVELIKKHQQFQDRDIQSLRFVLQSVVTKYEYDKIVGLNKEEPFMCIYSGNMVDELRRVRALNLVKENYYGAFTKLINQYKNNKESFDLKEFLSITEQGKTYLELRADLLNSVS